MSRLLDRVREALRARHYSLRTEEAYLRRVREYILFFDRKHPSEMGAKEVSAFLTHLAVGRQVAASTQSQALSALLFLYREALDLPIEWVDDVERAKAPKRLAAYRHDSVAICGVVIQRNARGGRGKARFSRPDEQTYVVPSLAVIMRLGAQETE